MHVTPRVCEQYAYRVACVHGCVWPVDQQRGGDVVTRLHRHVQGCVSLSVPRTLPRTALQQRLHLIYSAVLPVAWGSKKRGRECTYRLETAKHGKGMGIEGDRMMRYIRTGAGKEDTTEGRYEGTNMRKHPNRVVWMYGWGTVEHASGCVGARGTQKARANQEAGVR